VVSPDYVSEVMSDPVVLQNNSSQKWLSGNVMYVEGPITIRSVAPPRCSPLVG